MLNGLGHLHQYRFLGPPLSGILISKWYGHGSRFLYFNNYCPVVLIIAQVVEIVGLNMFVRSYIVNILVFVK